jgi:hypothetical protein
MATNSMPKPFQIPLNLGTNTITYPNTSLSNQLKTVAFYQAVPKQKKIYLVKVGDITMTKQVAANDKRT